MNEKKLEIFKQNNFYERLLNDITTYFIDLIGSNYPLLQVFKIYEVKVKNETRPEF